VIGRATGVDGTGAVAEALATARLELLGARRRHSGRHALPSRDSVAAVVHGLRAAFFPDHVTTQALSDEAALRFVGASLDSALRGLREQVLCALWFACDHHGEVEGAADADCSSCSRKALEITEAFAAHLPAIRTLLASDIRAAYDSDPAAQSLDEALLCYAGLTAVLHHRLAHALHLLGVPLVPRIISALAHAQTGVDIHPAAKIGGRFFIDHGTGVVIGETCLIGEHVRLYQGVTLGAKSFELDEAGHPVKGVPRHPIVEDDVVIYAGATILGRVTIGRGSIIGGNVWLTKSAPAGSRITQAQVRQEAFQDGAGI
jgi:serine O-acetyltransferase